MQTLPNHFSGLLSNIEPSEERLKLAQQTPDLVRDYLKQSEDIIIVEPYSRLAGSYARHTAVGDIKDVDIVVFLNKDYKDEEPASVLRKLKKALDGLPNRSVVELRSQRRSIHVYFTDCDFHLDIVPAIAPNETTMPLLVPDKSQAKWIKSNPLGYNDYLSIINGENQDKVVPLVKLIKYWRNIQMIYKRPKSYWLECLVVHQIGKKVKVDGKSYAELFADMLDAIYDKFSYILNYTNGKHPNVWVTNPPIKNNGPHLYEDGSLCLYYPKDNSWNTQLWLAKTIVPWTAEWLLLYELWLETGIWWGSEAPHNDSKSKNR